MWKLSFCHTWPYLEISAQLKSQTSLSLQDGATKVALLWDSSTARLVLNFKLCLFSNYTSHLIKIFYLNSNKLEWKMTSDGRRHPMEDDLMEEDLQRKTTFNGRRPPMEDDLQCKTTSNERQPLMEDNLQWKTTSNERQPSMEDDLQWKTNSNKRWAPMEDNLQWKTTYNARRPSMDSKI